MSRERLGTDDRHRTLYRRRRIHRRLRAKVTGERWATTEVERLLSDLTLPSRVEKATIELYRKAVETHTLRGRDTKTLLAAAAYAACRQCGVPFTLDEIAEQAGISRKDIGKNFRWLVYELRLKLRPASPLDYLDRFCRRLGAGECVQSSARRILQRADEKEIISGRGATGMAAAAIYIASIQCGEKITQRAVAGVAGVTEVTLRNRYKELVDRLNLDVDA